MTNESSVKNLSWSAIGDDQVWGDYLIRRCQIGALPPYYKMFERGKFIGVHQTPEHARELCMARAGAIE